MIESKHVYLIFDIGANGGDKADRFLRMGARVVCVEPDKYCCSLLNRRFRNCLDRLTIVSKAVSDVAESKVFYSLEDGSAYNTFSEKWATQISQKNNQLNIQENQVQTVTIDDLIATHGKPSLIKIDIEGYELNALKGLNSKIASITFELNLPDFLDEGLECIDRLTLIDPDCSFNYFIDCERGFLLLQNVDANNFKKLLSETDVKYMEIFCQMNASIE